MPKTKIKSVAQRGIFLLLTLYIGTSISSCAVRANRSFSSREASISYPTSDLRVYNEEGRFLPNPESLCYTKFNVDPSGDWLQDIVALGKRYIGKPYRYRGPGYTFDCSGYMRFLFNSIGIKLAASSSDIASTTKPIKQPAPGDLLFFKGRNSRSRRVGHVALLVAIKPNGDYVMLHSTNSGGVVMETMNRNRYFSKRYVGAGRIPALTKDFEARLHLHHADQDADMKSRIVPPTYETPLPIIGKDQQLPANLRIPTLPVSRG